MVSDNRGKEPRGRSVAIKGRGWGRVGGGVGAGWERGRGGGEGRGGGGERYSPELKVKPAQLFFKHCQSC